MDGAATRLLRTALLARTLAQRGHEVVYWNAAFNHQQKVMRSVGGPVRQEGLYDAMLLPGRAYANNVSIARILSQRENAAGFERLAPQQPRPDLIVCGFPTIELAAAVRDYATRHGIPYVIDARDMWPEVIRDHLPAWLRVPAFPILKYWRRLRKHAFRDAAAIIGVSSLFVKWACDVAGRGVESRDRSIYLAADLNSHDAETMARARAFWDEVLGRVDDQTTTVMVAGNLSARVDIMTAVEAAVRVHAENDRRFRLVVCGKGDLEDQIAAMAERSANLHFAGWRNGAEIAALAERCSAGVLAYSNTPDLVASFPNKVGEYLSFGLPVVTPLKGEVKRQLGPRNLLITYDEGDVASAVSAFQSIQPRVPADQNASAKELFAELFDPRKIYSDFADHLETLAD